MHWPTWWEVTLGSFGGWQSTREHTTSIQMASSKDYGVFYCNLVLNRGSVELYNLNIYPREKLKMSFLNWVTGGFEEWSCHGLFPVNRIRRSPPWYIKVTVPEEKDTGQEASVDPCSHSYTTGELLCCLHPALDWVCETEFQSIMDLGLPFLWHWFCRIEAGRPIVTRAAAMWPVGARCLLHLSSDIFCWTQNFDLSLLYKGFPELSRWQGEISHARKWRPLLL